MTEMTGRELENTALVLAGLARQLQPGAVHDEVSALVEALRRAAEAAKDPVPRDDVWFEAGAREQAQQIGRALDR